MESNPIPVKRLKRDRVWAAATFLGMPVSPMTSSKKGRSNPWDGKVLHGLIGGTKQPHSIEWLWHEVGHWLTAPDEGRSMEGWGSRAPPDVADWQKFPQLPDAPYDDQVASAFGVWCQLKLGRDVSGARRHASDHGWDNEEPLSVNNRALFDALRFLRDLGTEGKGADHFGQPFSVNDALALRRAVTRLSELGIRFTTRVACD